MNGEENRGDDRVLTVSPDVVVTLFALHRMNNSGQSGTDKSDNGAGFAHSIFPFQKRLRNSWKNKTERLTFKTNLTRQDYLPFIQ